RQLLELVAVSCAPPKVNAENRRRAVRDERLDLSGADVVCLRIDIAEDRGETLPEHGVSGSDESKRGHDYLPLRLGCAESKLDGSSAIGHGDAIRDSVRLADRVLEFAYVRSAIREEAALEDLSGARDELFDPRACRSADVYRLRKRRHPC